MSNLIALLAGLLFAIGLILSGMTQPAKCTGFLDFTGDWDASLVFVMIGGIGTHIIAQRLRLRWSKPILAQTFPKYSLTAIDRRLLIGSTIFGVGWGLAGLCPGPALVSLIAILSWS